MNVPKLRFKEFDGEWEERKLEESVSNIGTGKSEFKINLKSAENKFAILGSTSIIGFDATYDYEGEFILTARVGANAGNLYRYNGKVKISDNTVYIQGTNLSFVYALLNKFNLKKLSFGTGQPLIKASELKKLSLFYPNAKEQNKIGYFLELLNKKIRLQQQKIDLLQEQKKGFLQKMFPKAGETQPEMRFDGFTEDWEVNKLNRYLKTSKEKNINEIYSKTDVLSVSGDYGIVNQIEFQGRSFAGVSVAPYGVVEKGDIVYTKSPLKSNPYGIIKVNKGKVGIVSTLYAIYKVKANTDANFIEYYFANDFRLNKYLKPLVNKGAKNDMKVSDDNAIVGNVVFPKGLEEQKKITAFFNKLDEVICVQKRKLELLQQQKKGFMQQMFI